MNTVDLNLRARSYLLGQDQAELARPNNHIMICLFDDNANVNKSGDIKLNSIVLFFNLKPKISGNTFLVHSTKERNDNFNFVGCFSKIDSLSF